MNVRYECVIYGKTPNTTTQIFRDEKTIGYIFINTGNVPVTLNNYLLLPSNSFKTYDSNLIDKTFWKATFDLINTVYTSCAQTNTELTTLIISQI